MDFTKRKVLFFIVVLAFGLTVLSVGELFAPDEGCTPGYWKRLAKEGDSPWIDLTGYVPGDLLCNVWNFPAEFSDICWNEKENRPTTLLDALKFHGGDEIEGALRIFLRAATAGLLNAAARRKGIEDTGCPYIYGSAYPAYIDFIQSLIDYDLEESPIPRDDLLKDARTQDFNNNRGCPLNRHGIRVWDYPVPCLPFF